MPHVSMRTASGSRKCCQELQEAWWSDVMVHLIRNWKESVCSTFVTKGIALYFTLRDCPVWILVAE